MNDIRIIIAARGGAALGSLETRVLVTARRFKELHAAPDKDIKPLDQIEHATRSMQAPELQVIAESNALGSAN